MITAYSAKLGRIIQFSAEVYSPRTLRHAQTYAFQVAAENLHSRSNALLIPLPADYSKGVDIAFLRRGTLDQVAKPILGLIASKEKTTSSEGSLSDFKVAIAPTSERLSLAIADLPPECRPPINRGLVQEIGTRYPGWPVAVCAWDGSISSSPIAFCFEPLHPHYLHIPGLSRRGAGPPKEQSTLSLFGSSINPVGLDTKVFPELLAGYLPSKLWGRFRQDLEFDQDYRISLRSLKKLVDVENTNDLHQRVNPGLWSIALEPYTLR